MHYYQSRNGNVVLAVDSAVFATTMIPVIVLPLEKWERLVELFNGWVPTCACDGHCETCDEDREIKAIIAAVEGENQ